MTADDNAGFSIRVPESGCELDIRPAIRDGNITLLVEQRIREVPELGEHRGELVRHLRRQARDAGESGAVYCACFALVLDDSVVPGSITVSVMLPPRAGAGVDAMAEQSPTQDAVEDAAEDGDRWMSRSMVDLEGIGRVPRSQGVTDIRLPDGSGWIRMIVMQTFIPLDSQRLLLVGAASPAIDLAEPLLELFDALTGILARVPASSPTSAREIQCPDIAGVAADVVPGRVSARLRRRSMARRTRSERTWDVGRTRIHEDITALGSIPGDSVKTYRQADGQIASALTPQETVQQGGGGHAAI
jgi:hypothetical protein